MSDRRDYPDETKAAVLAALLAGQAVNEVAATYKVPVGTVKSWWSRQRNSQEVATVATDKKERIGELLLDYLATSLETLREQHTVFRDADWLRKQPASELAVLHGVIADKSIRLLEALAPEDGGEEGSGG